MTTHATGVREQLTALYAAAVARVEPAAMVQRYLRLEGDTLSVIGVDGTEPVRVDLRRFRTVRLLGVGKAAVAMAHGVEAVLGARLKGGLVVAPHPAGTDADPHGHASTGAATAAPAAGAAIATGAGSGAADSGTRASPPPPGAGATPATEAGSAAGGRGIPPRPTPTSARGAGSPAANAGSAARATGPAAARSNAPSTPAAGRPEGSLRQALPATGGTPSTPVAAGRPEDSRLSPPPAGRTGGPTAVHLQRTRVLTAAHPVPDAASVAAGEAFAAACRQATADTLLITVVSGGGSALLAAPYAGAGHRLTLADKQETTRLLLASGATIGELNCVRKHLSGLKGGRAAALMYPAASLNLILSDVVGDRLDTIASGITAPDSTSFADAVAILDRYRLTGQVPAAVRTLLAAGAAGTVEDTPGPEHPAFEQTRNLLLGSGRAAVEAAADAARSAGFNTRILSTQLIGEAREVAKVFASLARDVRDRRLDLGPPACILAGGETTVTVTGSGTGGRCQEMALAFMGELANDPEPPPAAFLAAGTDGIDGPTDAAGAFADPQTSAAATARRLEPGAFLASNDSYGFFSPCEALFKPGPTGTNVADLYLLVVLDR